MSKYLVFDIGCLECGEGSQPLGIFKTKKEAQQVIDEYLDPETSWGREGWSGQHEVEIFKMPAKGNEITE